MCRILITLALDIMWDFAESSLVICNLHILTYFYFTKCKILLNLHIQCIAMSHLELRYNTELCVFVLLTVFVWSSRCVLSWWRAATVTWRCVTHLKVSWSPPARRSWSWRPETRSQCRQPGTTTLWRARAAPATPSPASWSSPPPRAPASDP